jgi:hypothetical protein
MAHAEPLSVKDVGSAGVDVVVALNPNVTEPPAGMSALYDTPFAVACPLATVTVDDQACESCCPEGNSHASCHALIALVPLLDTVTFAVKPPLHVLGRVYATAQEPVLPPPVDVLTVTPEDAGDALPAESVATTVNEYWVSAVRPLTVTEFVAEVATTWLPL